MDSAGWTGVGVGYHAAYPPPFSVTWSLGKRPLSTAIKTTNNSLQNNREQTGHRKYHCCGVRETWWEEITRLSNLVQSHRVRGIFCLFSPFLREFILIRFWSLRLLSEYVFTPIELPPPRPSGLPNAACVRERVISMVWNIWMDIITSYARPVIVNFVILFMCFICASWRCNFLCPRGLTFTCWGCCGLWLWHKPAELAHSFLFCSCVYFCLSGPFNCISFHKFSL